MSPILAGPSVQNAEPPAPRITRPTMHDAYVLDVVTTTAPTMAMILLMSSTGRRPIKWLSGLQSQGATA